MKEIKNKIYELEGLLELADMRPEKFAALKPLIDRRLEEIMALWSNIQEEEPVEKEESEEDPDDEPLYLRPDEDDEPDEDEKVITEVMAETPDPVKPAEKEDNTGDSESTVLKPEEREEREKKEERAGKEEIEEREERKIEKGAGKEERALPTEKRIALCLNDRFRFIRTLGMGDKAEFERRLSRLANAGDFETARDYIVDECCLDPDDADVADLIEIVRTYYDL